MRLDVTIYFRDKSHDYTKFEAERILSVHTDDVYFVVKLLNFDEYRFPLDNILFISYKWAGVNKDVKG